MTGLTYIEYVAVCYSVLHFVAVCCWVLQCVAVCCRVLTERIHIEYVAVCCSVLQCVEVCCSVLQRVVVCCRRLPRLQHTIHCNTLLQLAISLQHNVVVDNLNTLNFVQHDSFTCKILFNMSFIYKSRH